MSKQQLTATMQDGQIITRTTSHDYRYVVLAYSDNSWGWIQWTTRIDLAQKAQRRYANQRSTFSGQPIYDEVRIVKVDTPGLTYGNQ
jgi:hypothetical protein